MKNIVLIGMMGSGKSTVGKLLSQALGRELADTDALIEKQEGCTVSEIFALHGEMTFRAMEVEVSKELAGQNSLIISCGGGLPMTDACMEALGQTGLVFWLDRDPGRTWDSLDISARPLAQNGREDFLSRYTQRAPTYRRWAHHIISDPPSAEHAVREILSILQREEHAP